MDFIQDLYYKTRIKLNINKEEFLDMTLVEVLNLLSEYDKIKSLEFLQQANYISALVMNEKADDNYKNIYDNIIGLDTVDVNKLIKYRNISKRLHLKYPKELDKIGGD